MPSEKINITWPELKTARVEKHLRQQQAMVRNRRYAELTSSDLPVAHNFHVASIFYNSIFCLAAFGLLGGILAWTGGALLHLRPDPRNEADQVLACIRQIRQTVSDTPGADGITSRQADAAIKNVLLQAGDNPYLNVYLDSSLTAAQQRQRTEVLSQADRWREVVINILAFGLCGLLVSVCLSIAAPVIDRNPSAVIVNGSIGALLGLMGGLAASLVVDRVYQAIGGGDHGLLRQYLARGASWAVLGCFVAVAPGIVARNSKRLFIGVAGGAIGGAVGGLLLDPVAQLSASPELGRLCAMLCIGLLTGAATGAIELAARTGWLKVIGGVITGKQFILYRNPTYVGSGPECQIYLFRDPLVGRRHAAIHLLKGRIEIEDLPLGSATLVNGKRIQRRRLRDGDRIGIGSNTFLFQEKDRQS